VSIDRHLIDQGINSFWAICVDYLSHTPGETGHNPNLSRSRVDYKTILSPGEFVVFSRLRELRKELAQTEAVPVYALGLSERLCCNSFACLRFSWFKRGLPDDFGSRLR
jgi:hypothetical protein